MGNEEEMISSFSPIPVRPSSRDELNRASHHSWRLEGQWQSIRRQITSRINRCVEPISFIGIQSSNRAAQEKLVHKYLSCKHVSETSRIFLKDLLVVLARKLVDINFQSPHRIIIKNITSTSYIHKSQNHQTCFAQQNSSTLIRMSKTLLE